MHLGSATFNDKLFYPHFERRVKRSAMLCEARSRVWRVATRWEIFFDILRSVRWLSCIHREPKRSLTYLNHVHYLIDIWCAEQSGCFPPVPRPISIRSRSSISVCSDSSQQHPAMAVNFFKEYSDAHATKVEGLVSQEYESGWSRKGISNLQFHPSGPSNQRGHYVVSLMAHTVFQINLGWWPPY